MRAAALIRQTLAPCLAVVHSVRFACVLDVVDGLLRGRRRTAIGLARSIPNAVADKHKIRRVDRLLGNWRLHAEVPFFCAAIARRLLERRRRPLILVDWTGLDPSGSDPGHMTHRARLYHASKEMWQRSLAPREVTERICFPPMALG